MKNTILPLITSKNLKSIVTFWVLFAFALTNSFAQDFCGTKVSELEYKEALKEYLKIKANVKTSKINAVYTLRNIPVKFYVGSTLSQDVMSSKIALIMAYLNRVYLPMKYQFYIQESNGIYYDPLRRSDENLLEKTPIGEVPHFHELANFSLQALNIFIFDNLSNPTIGGYAYTVGRNTGTNRQNRNFVVIKNSLTNNSSIEFSNNYLQESVAHEIGHFLGLYHTFEHVQQGTNNPDCSLVESNDLIDTTPIDPYEYPNNYRLNSSCQYIGGTGSVCNKLFSSFTPLMNNIMSYWPSLSYCLSNTFLDYGVTFVDEQYSEMYRLSENNIFNNNPEFTLNAPALSSYPIISLSTNTTYKQITWNAVANATGYIIERSTSSTIGFTPVGGVGSSILIFTDGPLSNNITYYYRVRCSNSTSYSQTIATGCTPTTENVTFYNNTSPTNQKDTWYKTYQTKAIKWNIIQKNKTGTVTIGEAAKSVILVAKSIWDSKYTTLSKPCADQSEYAAYVQEMKNLGVLGSSITGNEALDLDTFSDMIFKVVLNAGAGQGSTQPLPSVYIRNNTRFVGTVKGKNLANVGTLRYAGMNTNTGLPIRTAEYMLDTKTTINRGIFARILTGAYETKYYIVKNQLKQGRVNATDDIDDIASIGFKPEYDDEVPDGSPTLQIAGASEIIQSGVQWWVEVNPSLLGNNQQFYWTVEGATQGARLDPYSGYSNSRRIYFTAPVVTTETIVNMVIYGVSDDGKAVEISKQFKVVPIPNNGCITLLIPNISFDRVAGSFTSTKTCNIKNGSTSSTASLSMTITGPNAINFYVTPTNTTLGSGSPMGLDVSCNASSVGTYTAILEITQTGLNGCPQKITVPLLANVTAATSEPGLTWAAPIVEGTVFYSGSNIPSGANNLQVSNNLTTGTEFRCQASGGNLTIINSCTITPQTTASFPDGMFSKSVRFWARKKDCGTNTATGNWVLTPAMIVIPTPNPNININYPNGEEILTGNQMYEIKWSGSSTSPVTLLYSTDGGVTFPNTIATNLNSANSSYNWIVPILAGYASSVRIKIISGTFSDVSDGNFAIKRPMNLSSTVQHGCDDKGQILITASGGKGPLSYLVTPGNYTTNDIRGLNAGTYTVKVTDLTGESLQTTVTVPTYTPRDFTYTKTDATCGGKNGSIRITGFSDGYVPTRFWYYKDGVSVGTFDTKINNLEAGRYGISAYQDFGDFACGVYKIIDINPDNNFSVSSVVTDANCGQSDGAITLTASSAATFLWGNGATTNSVSSLQQGTQFVTVRNTATGCNLPLNYEVGVKPTVFISSGQNFNNVVSNQMAIINSAILFIKPNSFAIQKYNSTDFSFQQELDFSSNISYSGFTRLKEIHQKYGMIPDPISHTTRIGIVLDKTGTNEYLTADLNYSSGSLNSQQIFVNGNNRLFGYLGGGVVSLNTNNTINHLSYYGISTLNGCYNHLQTTYDVFSNNAYAIQSCANKVDVLNYDTQFRVAQTYNTTGLPIRAYSNYAFPNCFVTIANSAFQLEIFKSDNTLNYILPLPSQFSIATTIFTNEFSGDSEYLLISSSSGKVAIFSKSRKSFIDVVDIGMSINKVGYDYVTKRFFFLNGTTLKYITITEPSLSVNSTKTDVACTQTGSVSLTVSGGGTPTYSWSNGATTKDISNLAVGTYTVTVTPSDGGCALKKSIKIENAGIVPTATVIIPSSQTSFCTGENIQLVANQGTGLTYQWQKDGVDISGATQQTYYAIVGGAYRVKVKNNTGCENPSTAVTLTQKPLPTASITPLSATSICQGSSVTLRANSAANQTYIWIKDGSVLQGQTSMDLLANSAGSYQVVTALTGCSNISTSVPVTVTPLATATLTGTQTINSGQSATLSVALTGTSPWSIVVNGVTYSSITISPYTFSVTPNATTTYNISSVSNSCGTGTFSGSAVVTVNSVCTQMYTTKTGNWNDVTVWSCNRLPTSADVVTIKANHFITIPASYTANAKNAIFETGGKIIEAANTSKLCLSCPDIPVNGLVAYYPFNGNVNDASGNTNNGTNNGAVLTTDRFGNISNAFTFGGNSSIDIGSNIQDGIFTLNFWVNIASLPTSTNAYALISKLDNNAPNLFKNFEVNMNNTGKVNLILANGNIWSSISANGSLTPNQWKMVTIKYDGTTASIFYNGVLDNSSNMSPYAKSNVKIVFGRRAVPNVSSTDNLFLSGKLDDIRIYNRALSATEIATIYNGEK